MAKQEKAVTPPYTTYSSFTNLINGLREHGLPSHVTRSVVSGSNSGKATMLASLKALGLIDSQFVPTAVMKKLVQEGNRFPTNLRAVMDATYPFLLDGSIDLNTTTSEIVAQKFKDAGASGSTVSKGMAFFLAAAKDAGIAVSARVKAPAPVRNGSTRSKVKSHGAEIDREDDDGAEDDRVPPGMVRIPIPLHGMSDGAILLPEGLSKKQWDYAKKMALFILDNYHTDFDADGGGE